MLRRSFLLFVLYGLYKSISAAKIINFGRNRCFFSSIPPDFSSNLGEIDDFLLDSARIRVFD